MSETQRTLERELERLSPPRIWFDELVQRRDRKRRDQRIRAAVLGLAIAIAVGWLGVNAIDLAVETAAEWSPPRPAAAGGRRTPPPGTAGCRSGTASERDRQRMSGRRASARTRARDGS